MQTDETRTNVVQVKRSLHFHPFCFKHCWCELTLCIPASPGTPDFVCVIKRFFMARCVFHIIWILIIHLWLSLLITGTTEGKSEALTYISYYFKMFFIYIIMSMVTLSLSLSLSHSLSLQMTFSFSFNWVRSIVINGKMKIHRFNCELWSKNMVFIRESVNNHSLASLLWFSEH